MSQENVQAIQTLYRAAAQGEMDIALSVLHSNILVYGQESLPYGGLYQGYAGYQQLFTELIKVWVNFTFLPQEFMDTNDVVIAVMQLQGEAKATGKKLDMRMYEFWKMQNGKAIECSSLVEDTAKTLELLKSILRTVFKEGYDRNKAQKRKK